MSLAREGQCDLYISIFQPVLGVQISFIFHRFGIICVHKEHEVASLTLGNPIKVLFFSPELLY